jgi:hypothetical protein
MIHLRLATICWALAVSTTAAAEPKVQVICPPASYDDRSDRNRSVPRGPHPVVLIASGRIQKLPNFVPEKPPASGTVVRRNDAGRELGEMLIDRVFFGSPPGKTIRVGPGSHLELPVDTDQQPKVYGLTIGDHKGESVYSLDGYYRYDRTYSMQDLKGIEALARARLDFLVLSSETVLVGTADARDVAKGVHQILVDRVLYGDFKPGQRLLIDAKEQLPLPLTGPDPFIYFLSGHDGDIGPEAQQKVHTRWSIEAIDVVTASLNRRGDYPIRDEVDEDGRTERIQEILFLGPRADAIEMLCSHNETIRYLAARRLVHDGKAAIPDVVAAIGANLWREPKPNESFIGQSNLISLLSFLERQRTDGEVTRLVDDLLEKAEHGATFPNRPVSDAEELHRRSFYYGLDDESNHSLAWLLLSLKEPDAAKLFGQRLIKLRDIAAYGWKDEAQEVLDRSHLEDHLALSEVEPQSLQTPKVRWPAVFKTPPEPAHSSQIVLLEFDRDGTELVSTDAQGVECRWSSKSGQFLARRERKLPSDATPGLSNGVTLHWAENGTAWFFVENRRGFYRPPESFEFRVATPPPSREMLEDATFDARVAGRSLGKVEPRWGHHEPSGLVPGGRWLNIGTHIFSRTDLKLVSAVNVSGEVTQMRFNSDGARYAIVTSDTQRRASPLGMDLWFNEIISQRIRIHNTATGKTLFSVMTNTPVHLLALSADGRRVATLNEEQEFTVWRLPE